MTYKSLGNTNYGWFKSKHHFSFANYYNPARMDFGKLRVVNNDWVEPDTGFPSHPHSNVLFALAPLLIEIVRVIKASLKQVRYK